MNNAEKLNKLKEFEIINPLKFSAEQFEKIKEDIINPRDGIVCDEYVEFKLWFNGLKSRQEYFAEYVEKILPVKNNKRILEVGCGKNALLSKILADKGYKVTAIDPEVNIEVMQSNFTIIKEKFDYNIADISEYDVVVAQEPCEATEHIVRACVREKKKFVILLCGTAHKLINGEEPKDVFEWYEYLKKIGGESCEIIYTRIIPGYICPIMIGMFC